MRYNTRRADEAILKMEPFTTNGNLYGVVITGGLAIFSYAEPIAFFDPEKKRAHLNETRYSNTTSRHQTEARSAAMDLQAQNWDVDRWTAKDFEEVTGLSTMNRNPFYHFSH